MLVLKCAAFIGALFSRFLVSVMTHKCMNSFGWKKTLRKSYLVSACALPTEALLLKSFKVLGREVKPLCCCHFSLTSHDEAACELTTVISFYSGPCRIIQYIRSVPVNCLHGGIPLMIIDHLVCCISKLTDGVIDSWLIPPRLQPRYSWSSGKEGGQSWLTTGISLIGKRKRCVSNIIE